MFAGAAMFASFGAFYFYFPSIFGLKFSRIWGYLHITYFLLGQLMTVIPMFWLGYSGMPRRVLDYPASLGGWHAIVSAGHLLSVAGLIAFFVMIFDSMRQGRPAIRNSFGVSRFNTRFSFYIYESARLLHIQHKGWYIARYSRTLDMSRKLVKYGNHELLETTLYSYVLVQKSANTRKADTTNPLLVNLIKGN
jgi:heme/copper-type cytochrome/quinol oxidase subunit 1